MKEASWTQSQPYSTDVRKKKEVMPANKNKLFKRRYDGLIWRLMKTNLFHIHTLHPHATTVLKKMKISLIISKFPACKHPMDETKHRPECPRQTHSHLSPTIALPTVMGPLSCAFWSSAKIQYVQSPERCNKTQIYKKAKGQGGRSLRSHYYDGAETTQVVILEKCCSEVY